MILAGLAAAFLITRLARRYGVPLKVAPAIEPPPRARRGKIGAGRDDD